MLTIPMNLIRASIPCAATTKDVRYYLQGALFEYTAADKQLRIVSTNGSIMSCFSAHYPECDALDFSFIVPIETLKLAAKAKAPALTVAKVDDKRYALGEFVFEPIDDGKFPDYRRVIPVKVSEASELDYNPELLLRANEAMRHARGVSKGIFYHLSRNGSSGAVLHDGHSDAIVIIMPMRVVKYNEPMPLYRGFN